MRTLNHLFQPLTIGSMTLRNRTFMSPMSLGYESQDGTISEQMSRYWGDRAKGGVAAIILDVVSVDPRVPYLGNTMHFGAEHAMASFKRFTDEIHSYGAKVLPQISHPGPESISSFFGVTPVAPSSYINSLGQKTRALKKDELPAIVEQYAVAAAMAREAGFDGIELHAAHAYMLLGSFLSPLRNKRSDEYGGTLMNRARLLFEVLDAIAEKAGKDFPLILRVAGDERHPDGNSVHDFIRLLPYLEDHGVDAIEVSGGTQYESPNKIIPCYGEPEGVNLPEAQLIKQATSLPVIVVGKILDPRHADQIIALKQADGVVLGRALLADPQWVNKAKEGDFLGISPCVSCAVGCIGEQGKQKPGTCSIHPATGREAEMEIHPAKEKKSIVVVGGGMAGMTAARVSAMRGHFVTLLEKEETLGGQMKLACVPPSKQEVSNWVIYLEEQLRRLDVEVITDCEATTETIREYKPDVVVVATGAKQFRPCADTVSDDLSLMAWDVISNEKEILGGNVVVVGGGSVGLETAELLLHRARGPMSITVMEMLDEVGIDMVPNNKSPLLARLSHAGVNIMTGAQLLSAEPGTVTYKSGDDIKQLHGISHIVFACGSQSNNALYEKIKDQFDHVVLVGDAVTPAQALEAVRGAWEAMLEV